MINIPVLETERLTLRGLKEADFAPLAEFYASDRSKFVGGPVTAERSWRIMAGEIGHWELRGYGRFAVEEKSSGKLVGLIGPWNPIGWPEAELGWDLMNGFEGKGFAFEAALATRAYAYNTLGWKTAISLVAPGNVGSAALARRMGAVPEGMFTHEQNGKLEIFRHPAPEALQ